MTEPLGGFVGGGGARAVGRRGQGGGRQDVWSLRGGIGGLVAVSAACVHSLMHTPTLARWIRSHDSLILLWIWLMLVSYVLMEVFAWFFLGNLRAFERNRAREKIFEKAVQGAMLVVAISYDFREALYWLIWLTPTTFLASSLRLIKDRLNNPIPADAISRYRTSFKFFVYSAAVACASLLWMILGAGFVFHDVHLKTKIILLYEVTSLVLACISVQLSLFASPSHHVSWSGVLVSTQLMRIFSGFFLVLQQFFVWQQGASGVIHAADLLLFMRIKTAIATIHQASQALRNHVLVCRTLGSALPDVEGDDEGGDDQGGNNSNDDSSGSRLFCVICREARRRGEGFKKLPCSHSFHFSCLQQWLTASSSIICPICRAPALPSVSRTASRSGQTRGATGGGAAAAAGNGTTRNPPSDRTQGNTQQQSSGSTSTSAGPSHLASQRSVPPPSSERHPASTSPATTTVVDGSAGTSSSPSLGERASGASTVKKNADALAAQHRGGSLGGDQDRGVERAGAEEGISIRVTAMSGCSSSSAAPSHAERHLNSAAVSGRPDCSTEGGTEQLSQLSQGTPSQGSSSQSSTCGMQTNERLREEAQASSSCQPSTHGVSSPPVGGEGGAGLIRQGVERRGMEGEQASASVDSNRDGSLGQETRMTLEDSSPSRLLHFSLEGEKRKDSSKAEGKRVSPSVSAQPSGTTSSLVTGPSISAFSTLSSSSSVLSSSPETKQASISSSSQSSPPPPGSVFSSTVSSDSSTLTGVAVGPSVLSSLRSGNGTSSSGGEPWVLVQGVSPSFRNPSSSPAFSEVDRPSYLSVNSASTEQAVTSALSLSSVRQHESSSASHTERASASSLASSSLPSPVVSSSPNSSSTSHFRESSNSQSSSTASPSVPSYGVSGSSSLPPPEGRRPPSASTAAAASVLAAAAMEAAAAAGRPQRDESATEQQDFEDDDEFEEEPYLPVVVVVALPSSDPETVAAAAGLFANFSPIPLQARAAVGRPPPPSPPPSSTASPPAPSPPPSQGMTVMPRLVVTTFPSTPAPSTIQSSSSPTLSSSSSSTGISRDKRSESMNTETASVSQPLGPVSDTAPSISMPATNSETGQLLRRTGDSEQMPHSTGPISSSSATGTSSSRVASGCPQRERVTETGLLNNRQIKGGGASSDGGQQERQAYTPTSEEKTFYNGTASSVEAMPAGGVSAGPSQGDTAGGLGFLGTPQATTDQSDGQTQEGQGRSDEEIAASLAVEMLAQEAASLATEPYVAAATVWGMTHAAALNLTPIAAFHVEVPDVFLDFSSFSVPGFFGRLIERVARYLIGLTGIRVIPLPALPRFAHQQLRVVPQLGFTPANAPNTVPPQGDAWLQQQQAERERPAPLEAREAQSTSVQQPLRTGQHLCGGTGETAQSASSEPEKLMPLEASSTEDHTHQVSENQDQSQRQEQQLQPQPEQIPGGGDRTGAVQPTLPHPGSTALPAEIGPSLVDKHAQDTQSADGQAQCGLDQTLNRPY